jgi:hypothetical protein
MCYLTHYENYNLKDQQFKKKIVLIELTCKYSKNHKAEKNNFALSPQIVRHIIAKGEVSKPNHIFQ